MQSLKQRRKQGQALDVGNIIGTLGTLRRKFVNKNMKNINHISWEHLEADREKTKVWDFIGFGLVFAGTVVVAGLAVLIF